MTPHTDSLDGMPPDEVRALVVVLLDRLGGAVEFTDDEIYNRRRSDFAVQITVTEGPAGRTFRVATVDQRTVAVEVVDPS